MGQGTGTLSASHKSKGGATVGATYAQRDGAVALSWTEKPYKVHAGQWQYSRHPCCAAGGRPPTCRLLPRTAAHLPPAAHPQAVLRGKLRGGGVKDVALSFVTTHEFTL
jgi:hypothetical protein